jgi:RNA polymerase sigma-70 factor (ECF subfamily)
MFAIASTIHDVPTSSLPSEDAATRAEMRRLVEAGIDRLPAAMRTVYVLRAIEGLTVEETAQALGLAPDGVRERFLRAKRLLRGALVHDFDLGLEYVFSFAGARCDRIVAGVLGRLEELPPGLS